MVCCPVCIYLGGSSSQEFELWGYINLLYLRFSEKITQALSVSRNTQVYIASEISLINNNYSIRTPMLFPDRTWRALAVKTLHKSLTTTAFSSTRFENFYDQSLAFGQDLASLGNTFIEKSVGGVCISQYLTLICFLKNGGEVYFYSPGFVSTFP
jgi:hypothetical protein